MRITKSLLHAALGIALTTVGAAAQDRPAATQDRQFMFSVSTLPSEVRHATVQLETGVGEGTFDEFPPPMIDTTSKNYLTIALEEVAQGKIKYQYR